MRVVRAFGLVEWFEHLIERCREDLAGLVGCEISLSDHLLEGMGQRHTEHAITPSEFRVTLGRHGRA